MIEHTQLLRVKKLKGGGIVATAARHNLREIQAERGADSHIDPTRTHLNIVLRGAVNAADVASLAVQLMEQAKAKRRKDEVLGLEVLISLRPASGIEERAFFEAAVNWTDSFFEIPILSAIIHNDEAAPHCHIIMLPLFDGRLIGSKLVGSRARLVAMQADFFEKVGQPYGLTRQVPQKRFSSVARAKAAASVIEYLANNTKSLKEPTICDALRDALTDNPMPVMAALGLEMPESEKPKVRTFSGIMTKRFKPEKPIGFKPVENVNPIGFAVTNDVEKEQSLSCVGFVNYPLTLEPPKASLEGDCQNEYIRERDAELTADYWDRERGEHIKPQTNIKPKSVELERMKGVIQAIRR